jgi:hypothetical protein
MGDVRRSVRTRNSIVDREINYTCSTDKIRLLLRVCSMVCYVSLRLDSYIEERTNNGRHLFR